MPPLFPPDYPYRPDAPLLSLGPSFAEEISRSVIQAVWRETPGRPEDGEVRIAASLTMLEAFHPRDHLECMLAAQAVGLHAAALDSLARANSSDMAEAMVIKFRQNAGQMSRGVSLILRDLERRQGKPLPERPEPPLAPKPGTPPPPPLDRPSAEPPPDESPADETRPHESPVDDAPELPEDIETRPDGTPGSLAAYAPKLLEQVCIPRESAIMIALATRPKPWRMVNAPDGEARPPAMADVADKPVADRVAPVSRPAIDPFGKMFTGDALARFTSARLDPDAPVETLCFEEDDSVVELELISTGGDPEAEAHRAAMIAAHPEGKPIVTLRYGGKKPPERPPDDG